MPVPTFNHTKELRGAELQPLLARAKDLLDEARRSTPEAMEPWQREQGALTAALQAVAGVQLRSAGDIDHSQVIPAWGTALAMFIAGGDDAPSEEIVVAFWRLIEGIYFKTCANLAEVRKVGEDGERVHDA